MKISVSWVEGDVQQGLRVVPEDHLDNADKLGFMVVLDPSQRDQYKRWGLLNLDTGEMLGGFDSKSGVALRLNALDLFPLRLCLNLAQLR